MAGLKPFREVPTNLVEWTKWMNAQDLEPSATVVRTSTTIIKNPPTLWEIEDFIADYVLNVDDAGKIKRCTAASATNVTVPAGVFTVGDQIVLLQYGAGVLTIVAGSGTVLNTPSTLVFNEQHGSVTIIMTDPDEWMVAGRMAP